VFADQHEPDGTPVGQAVRHKHGGMAGDVEGASIGEYLERALYDLGFRGRRQGNGRYPQRHPC
jgi:hypothetical protein